MSHATLMVDAIQGALKLKQEKRAETHVLEMKAINDAIAQEDKNVLNGFGQRLTAFIEAEGFELNTRWFNLIVWKKGTFPPSVTALLLRKKELVALDEEKRREYAKEAENLIIRTKAYHDKDFNVDPAVIEDFKKIYGL